VTGVQTCALPILLVVDDNTINLNVAVGLLRLCKINAETASSAKQAIELVRHNQYDIIFMDYRMPEMDGIEATKNIHELGIATPIIALTASAVVGAREKMLEGGMNDFLTKPIIKSDLKQILKKWLPSKKLLNPPLETDDSNTIGDMVDRNFWRKIEQIKCLSVSTGLDHIAGQRDEYRKTLRLMTHEIEKSNKTLPEYLSANDMKNFGIVVHSIKGALDNIGAMELSI
jgi:CheY-like chemotaxis protein